jgi:hypothetical protein
VVVFIVIRYGWWINGWWFHLVQLFWILRVVFRVTLSIFLIFTLLLPLHLCIILCIESNFVSILHALEIPWFMFNCWKTLQYNFESFISVALKLPLKCSSLIILSCPVTPREEIFWRICKCRILYMKWAYQHVIEIIIYGKWTCL